MSQFKFTKLEKSWILYDVGNSAYTLLITAIIPVYFNHLATAGGLSPSTYFAYWSYAASAVTLIVAIIGPFLGAITDRKGMRNKIFVSSVIIGVCACVIMGFMPTWVSFLALFMISKVGYSGSLIFSDSMLPDITTPERMDVVSSYGYALGYVGSCIPFIASLAVILFAEKLGLSSTSAIQIAIVINAVWWLLNTLPIARNYKQKHYVESTDNAFTHGFSELYKTFKLVLKDKRIYIFLLAFFFYIDGVYTIIFMATAYGESLGLDSNQLLLALLVTQIVAFPSAIILGRVTRRIRADIIITVAIVAYFFISLYAIGLNTTTEFWILAVSVGLFQGTIQALSRSYFSKIIPAEDSGKYFGFYDICGKGASFVGAFSIGLVTDLTGKQNYGVAVLSVMFLIGLVLFRIAVKANRNS